MSETIPYKALVRRNADGLERWLNHECEAQYLDNQLFWWTDGNAACDCNRGLFFDGDEAEDWDEGDSGDDPYPCGHERYTLLRLELPDGRWASDAEPFWHTKEG